MTKRVGIGIVGCGAISQAYLKNLGAFNNVAVVHVADIVAERARARAAEFGISRASDPAGLLADPDVEIVLNLTIPAAHADVALAAISAGRSVYSEKPLAATREEGSRVMAAAAAAGVLVGGAPDTFLSPSVQFARARIDAGALGDIVGGAAAMLCRGHESWHPSPHFYYQAGGGPLFDMGPYYLAALVNLCGPVARVQASATATWPSRRITSAPHAGEDIKVEVATHVVGILEFESGAVVSLTTSFDVWAGQMPPIQLYGTEGSIVVPDPNGFGGTVSSWDRDSGAWRDEEHGHPFLPLRGVGIADMARALREGGSHRPSGEFAYHVLDTMESLLEAAAAGHAVAVQSSCPRPQPFNSEDLASLQAVAV